MTIGRIILHATDKQGRMFIGEFTSDMLNHPRVLGGGLTTELHPEDRNFLVALAQRHIRLWHPDPEDIAFNEWQPRITHINEALWVWPDAGKPYFKFLLKPPLEVYWPDDATVQAK